MKLGDDSSLYLYSSTEAANGAKMIGLLNFAEQRKPDYRYRVAMAEAFAGGGTFYVSPGGENDGGSGRISHDYCDFLRQHQEWFNDTRSVAEVAVLYSWRDQAFIQGDPVAEAKVEFDPKRNYYQQTAAVFARMGVPHDCLIVEKGLSQRQLSRYKVIVVPELSLVTDGEAAALKRYVRAGGRLLMVGEFGGVTESGQDFKKRHPSLFTAWTHRQVGEGWAGRLDKGIIAFAPRATNDESIPAPPPSVDPDDVVGQIKKLGPLAIPVRPLSQPFRSACESVELSSQLKIESSTQMESTIRAKGDVRSIHLIRFGSTDGLTNRAVTVDYELPKGYSAKEVSAWSPDLPASAVSFSWKVAGGRLLVNISRIDNYALVGVVLSEQKSKLHSVLGSGLSAFPDWCGSRQSLPEKGRVEKVQNFPLEGLFSFEINSSLYVHERAGF